MATIMVTGNWCLVSGIWYLGTLLFGGRHAYDHETTLQFRKAHEVRRKEGRKKKKAEKRRVWGLGPGVSAGVGRAQNSSLRGELVMIIRVTV